MYLNIILGGLLIIGSLLSYFIGWIEDFLPFVIGAILLLLSTKRFWYSFRKTKSKYATMFLMIEFLVDLILIGLLFYLQDYLNLFIGLVIYARGVTYLLINYISTRKIKIGPYLLNIGYITLGSYLMFASIDSEQILTLGIVALLLIVGAIFLQAGITELVKKEEIEEQKEEEFKQEVKELKEKHKAELKGIENSEKKQQEIESLEEEVTHLKQEQKALKKDLKETEKKVEKPKPEEPEQEEVQTEDLTNKTVVQLKEMAKEKGLSGYSSLTKAELIKLLKEEAK
jgi:hypothetical protein